MIRLSSILRSTSKHPILLRNNILIRKNILFNSILNRSISIFEGFPTPKNSLYDSKLEKDSCGVGLVANMKKLASRQIVLDANEMLVDN